MRYKSIVLLLISMFLIGCNNTDNPVDSAVTLRNQILTSDGCVFHITLYADYGAEVYTFSMDCTSDKDGNVSFSVTNPKTIAGISGNIAAQKGTISFDDKLLAFQTMADGVLSPVSAPWIFINTIRTGYIRGCNVNKNSNSYWVEIDDTYAENPLRLNLLVEDGIPVSGEIYWKGRRILTILVENFSLV